MISFYRRCLDNVLNRKLSSKKLHKEYSIKLRKYLQSQIKRIQKQLSLRLKSKINSKKRKNLMSRNFLNKRISKMIYRTIMVILLNLMLRRLRALFTILKCLLLRRINSFGLDNYCKT